MLQSFSHRGQTGQRHDETGFFPREERRKKKSFLWRPQTLHGLTAISADRERVRKLKGAQLRQTEKNKLLYLSPSIPVYLSSYLSFYLPIHLTRPVYLCIYLPVCLSLGRPFCKRSLEEETREGTLMQRRFCALGRVQRRLEGC